MYARAWPYPQWVGLERAFQLALACVERKTKIQAAMRLVSYRVECNSFNHETEYPGVRCYSFGAGSV